MLCSLVSHRKDALLFENLSSKSFSIPYCKNIDQLEMWANAQRDGRPSEHTGWSKKADTRFIFAITLSILVDLQFFSLLQTAVNFQQNQY